MAIFKFFVISFNILPCPVEKFIFRIGYIKSFSLLVNILNVTSVPGDRPSPDSELSVQSHLNSFCLGDIDTRILLSMVNKLHYNYNIHFLTALTFITLTMPVSHTDVDQTKSPLSVSEDWQSTFCSRDDWYHAQCIKFHFQILGNKSTCSLALSNLCFVLLLDYLLMKFAHMTITFTLDTTCIFMNNLRDFAEN